MSDKQKALRNTMQSFSLKAFINKIQNDTQYMQI